MSIATYMDFGKQNYSLIVNNSCCYGKGNRIENHERGWEACICR